LHVSESTEHFSGCERRGPSRLAPPSQRRSWQQGCSAHQAAASPSSFGSLACVVCMRNLIDRFGPTRPGQWHGKLHKMRVWCTTLILGRASNSAVKVKMVIGTLLMVCLKDRTQWVE